MASSKRFAFGGRGRVTGAILAAVAGVFIAAPVLAAAHTPTDCLPPRGGPPFNAPPYDGKYRTAEQVHADFPGLVIDQAEHTIFQEAHCDTPPTALNVPAFENFNTNVSGNYRYLNGPSTPFSSPAPCVVKVTLTQVNGGTREFQTEMLQLNLSGGSLPAGVLVRESPTLQSTGHTTIRASSKAGFIIDSFFDLNLEVSLDGGLSWLPETNGPTRVELSGPGPAVPGDSFPGIALLVMLLIGTGIWVIRAGRSPARA
jgi:hypothetical protein